MAVLQLTVFPNTSLPFPPLPPTFLPCDMIGVKLSDFFLPCNPTWKIELQDGRGPVLKRG